MGGEEAGEFADLRPCFYPPTLPNKGGPPRGSQHRTDPTGDKVLSRPARARRIRTGMLGRGESSPGE
jgi:hypothetical protein